MAFNIRAFNLMATVQRDRIAPGPHERLHSVSICTSRLGTYVEQLDYLDGARAVSEGHDGRWNAFAHSATLGSTRSACDRGAWHGTTTP
jgi:hypothetical protein